MSVQDDTASVRERLAALLEAPSLSAAARAAATGMVGRLDSPARVSLFGLPGSGKTRVLNLLAGEVVVPNGFHPPTMSLRHGDEPSTHATLPDGTKQEWPGVEVRGLFATEPVFVEFRAPLPMLRHMSLLNIVADAEPADQRAAMRWAAKRTDIAIWCSQGFDEGEARLWAHAPEPLQDNGYLVLTGSRSPAARGEFIRSFAVDVAAATGLSLPEGAAQMIEEIRRCADRGRQGVTDAALLFLSRYESRRGAPPRVASRTHRVTTAQTSASPAQSAETAGVPSSPSATPLPVPRPISRPRPGSTRSAAARREVPRAAVDYLRRRAHELYEALPGYGDASGPRVLGHCLETMEKLVERVTAAESAEAAGADVEELVLDAADVILLLQSEDGDTPAADAVTLLLQLRRELEARLAA